MNNSLMKLIADIHADESGATATEYIILLTCVACFVIAAVKLFGNTVSSKYDVGRTAIITEVTF